METSLIDRRLDELARRRRWSRLLAVALPAMTVTLVVAATVIVGVRVAAPELSTALPWLIGAAAIAPWAYAALRTRGSVPRAQLAAEVDRRAGTHGLVMALAAQTPETRDETWVARVTRPLEDAPPAPMMTSRRPLGLAALAALAVVVAVAIPPRVPDPRPPAPPPWQASFAGVTERLAALEATPLIPPAERERLEELVDRLKREAEASGMSQATWEGIDRIERELDRALLDTETRLAEARAAAETLTQPRLGDPPPGSEAPYDPTDPDARRPPERDRLGKKPGDDGVAPDPDELLARSKRLLEQLTRERKAERLSRLARSLAGLAEQAPGLIGRHNLSPEAQEALERLLEEAERLGLLDEEAAGAAEALERMLGEGNEDGDGGDGAGGGGELSEADVERMLEEIEAALKAGELKLGGLGRGQGMGGLVARFKAGALAAGGGKGGTQRGPGHVELTRGADDPVVPGGIEHLPPGAVKHPDGSVTLGVTTRDPELSAAALEALRRGALRQHDPAHADARRAHVAPRHRGAVERYFQGSAPAPPDAPKD